MGMFDPLLDKRIERAIRRGVIDTLRPPMVSELRTVVDIVRRRPTLAELMADGDDAA